jgi:hypothetical protein
MQAVSIFGWVAACFVLLSFYLRTMMPLRIVAIAGNVMFIIYALLAEATPILVLHCALLPLNGWRLLEMIRLRRKFLDTSLAEIAPTLLLPFMRKGRSGLGQTIFNKGDPADNVYFLLQGEVRLQESNKRVVDGQLLGLTGVFSNERLRTDSAVCLTDVDYGVVPARKFWELVYQDPRFGNYVIRAIVQRQLATVADKVRPC